MQNQKSVISLPALSSDGWVTDPAKIGEYLFAHFLESDASQTELYLDQVCSFANILHEGKNSVQDTVRLLKDSLDKYFGRYFPTRTVEVAEVTGNFESRASVTLYIEYYSDGVKYTLYKLLKTNNGFLTDIINYNNEGVV